MPLIYEERNPTIWVGIFIGFWLVIMFLSISFSMLTSLTYWCSYFHWQRTVSNRYITLNSLPFKVAKDASIDQLLSPLFKTQLYPEPEKKKKRKTRRKFKRKNGWRLKLCKAGNGSGKGKRKREQLGKQWGQDNLRDLPRQQINDRDTQSKNPCESLSKPKRKHICLVKLSKKAAPSTKHQRLRYNNIHRQTTPGSPPKLKGRRKTLRLLHCAKHRIKRWTINAQIPQYDSFVPYASTEKYLEELLILESPVQDTDEQTDEWHPSMLFKKYRNSFNNCINE